MRFPLGSLFRSHLVCVGSVFKRCFNTDTQWNHNQLKCIQSPFDQPLNIQAGPGSGKTAVLCERIVEMVENKSYIHQDKICVFTFTNKAAKELKTILKEKLGLWNGKMKVGTFHGFCYRALIDCDVIDRNSTIFSDKTQRNFISEMCDLYEIFQELEGENYPFDYNDIGSIVQVCYSRFLPNKTKKEKEKNIDKDDPEEEEDEESDDEGDSEEKKLQTYINKLKANNESPDTTKTDKFYWIYHFYEHMRKAQNITDFNDMLLKMLHLLQNPQIANLYSERFKYFLVDEFQDTSIVQLEILEKIAQSKRVTIVGDRNQAIYEWRGASTRVWELFSSFFFGHTTIRLNVNYRSTLNIIKVQEEMLGVSENEKTTNHNENDGDLVKFIMFSDLGEQIDYIVENIRLFVHGYGLRYKDIAILFRNRYISWSCEKKLMFNRIPCIVLKGLGFKERKIVDRLTCYLKFLINPRDVTSFLRILNEPKRGFGVVSTNWVRNHLYSNLQSKQDIFDNIGEIKGLNKTQIPNINNLVDFFKKWRAELTNNVMPSDLIDLIIEDVNWKIEDKNREWVKILKDFSDIIEENEDEDELPKMENCGDRLRYFLSNFALEEDAKETEKNCVTVSTIHQAKGLEWKAVFLLNISDGVLPTTYFKETRYNKVDEERRLLYVGMSRAKENLFVLSSLKPSIFIQKFYNMNVSPYVVDCFSAEIYTPHPHRMHSRFL